MSVADCTTRAGSPPSETREGKHASSSPGFWRYNPSAHLTRQSVLGPGTRSARPGPALGEPLPERVLGQVSTGPLCPWGTPALGVPLPGASPPQCTPGPDVPLGPSRPRAPIHNLWTLLPFVSRAVPVVDSVLLQPCAINEIYPALQCSSHPVQQLVRKQHQQLVASERSTTPSEPQSKSIGHLHTVHTLKQSILQDTKLDAGTPSIQTLLRHRHDRGNFFCWWMIYICAFPITLPPHCCRYVFLVFVSKCSTIKVFKVLTRPSKR